MRVLITGAAGFIGQQLVNQLAIQHPQWTLIAADIRPQGWQGVRRNVEPVLLDIAQPREVQTCVATWQPQAIVHLASVV
ncbi:NAD(P)-dependent oxidoreductase, partial [Pseudomonas sp. CrR25]|nr:NAD(P)-dependent oxidoreductase [Pseudomonas sp. CrR25]